MKKYLILSILAVAALTASANEIMTKSSDGTYVVNTTTLCKKKGFKGITPVEVSIKKGKVVKVEALKNIESPGFFVKVTNSLLPLFDGVKLKEAKKMAEGALPDGCTGATYSSKAVQENIRMALEYYEAHK